MKWDAIGMTAAWLLAVAALVTEPAQPKHDEPPPGLLPIRSCQLHDLDTLVRCDVLLAWDVMLTNQSIRLHGVDALEVTRTRQTVEITDDEIVRGRQGLSKLVELSRDAKWYVRPTGESVYGRREGQLYFRSRSGQWVDVAEWIRTNGYERPAK